MGNAIHLEVNPLGVKAVVLVASATRDIHNC
jgi:hypothetical protein